MVEAASLKILLNFGQTEDERLFSDEDQNKGGNDLLINPICPVSEMFWFAQIQIFNL